MKAQEYLLKKGIKYIHQPKKFYNLTIAEMIEFLEDFAQKEKESVIKLIFIFIIHVTIFMFNSA
jgi:hypothetical protein